MSLSIFRPVNRSGSLTNRAITVAAAKAYGTTVVSVASNSMKANIPVAVRTKTELVRLGLTRLHRDHPRP